MEIPEEVPEIPDIQPDTKSKNRYIIPILLSVIIVGAGLWFSRGLHLGAMTSSDTKDGTITDDNREFIDFAENVVVTLRNISYTNIQQTRTDLARLISDDELTSYQKYYNDSGFIKLVSDKKLYVNFEKIERSTLEKRVGNVAAVKVIGVCAYHSDLSNTDAEYPFTFMVQVEKKDGNFVCTKIERL